MEDLTSGGQSLNQSFYFLLSRMFTLVNNQGFSNYLLQYYEANIQKENFNSLIAALTVMKSVCIEQSPISGFFLDNVGTLI